MHLNAFGCGWNGGWCDDDITKRCASDADCADTCEYSDKLCEKNRAIRCNVDDQCGNDGPCIDANAPNLRSIRGNFSLDRDQVSALESFLNLRSAQELSRVFRKDLQTANELPVSDTAGRTECARQDSDPGFAIMRKSFRQTVQSWSRIQARFETLMFPEDVDAPLQAADALSNLHTGISELARIGSEKNTGLRGFVTRYATFLRLSCIYRPCSMLLEQAIRLSTTDECFPYTNGEYLDNDEQNPRWQKCKDKAGIQ